MVSITNIISVIHLLIGMTKPMPHTDLCHTPNSHGWRTENAQTRPVRTRLHRHHKRSVGTAHGPRKRSFHVVVVTCTTTITVTFTTDILVVTFQSSISLFRITGCDGFFVWFLFHFAISSRIIRSCSWNKLCMQIGSCVQFRTNSLILNGNHPSRCTSLRLCDQIWHEWHEQGCCKFEKIKKHYKNQTDKHVFFVWISIHTCAQFMSRDCDAICTEQQECQ